jgi:phosphoketolase
MTTARTADTLPDEWLDQIIAYWNAANFLTVGQIYLQDAQRPACPSTWPGGPSASCMPPRLPSSR